MPKGYVPSVFISSTCYDLSQVRLDLKRSIEDLGLEPIISESFTFPVNPNADAVQNCLQVVKERADIFVLILGGRYGSPTGSGRSVTNLEYLEAKAKGVPVYVFVTKAILQLLPVWKTNRDGDFSTVVDTVKLFEFVEEVRNANNHWVFGFEEASHISETLRKQLAYLFMDALLIRERVRDLNLPASLNNLSGTSLRLLLEKEPAWEFFFFASVLSDEFSNNAELKWDVKYAIRSGSTRRFVSDDLRADVLTMSDWIQQKLADIRALVDSVQKLLNTAIQEAVGASGQPGNPEQITYVARKIGAFHRRLLEWTVSFNDADVRPQCQRVVELIANFSDDIIRQLETIPSRVRSETIKALEAKQKGESYEANIMVILSIPANDELTAEFDQLTSWVVEHADDPAITGN
jgi:hypothetical protein